MKKQHLIAGLAAAAVLGGAGYGLYAIGMQHGMPHSATSSAPTAASGQNNAAASGLTDPASGRKVLYWHDPMVPGHKFDKPGKSPFMDMELVPVYADDAGEEGGVSISPRIQQNLGIRTAEASKTNLVSVVEAVGSVAYNERNVALVPARSSGFVEKLHVRAPLDPVSKGQVLAELYVPEWVAAQEEYLSIRSMQGTGTEGLADAAKQRMRLAGMTDGQIRRIESSGRVHPRLSVISPIAGVMTELAVREGMTVMTGAPMFRINGLSTVWVHAEVPENMLAHVRPGNTVEARTPSLPSVTFQGKVGAILPEVNPSTRTIKARIELANPRQQLVPGMFVNVSFTPDKREDVLTVPSEAIIQTGKRNVVILAQEGGKFAPAEVEIGTEGNGQTEIRKGLEEGQKVVVSGQFLVDSEASLKGVLSRMNGPSAQEEDRTPQARTHRAEGKIESVDGDEIILSHGPIPSLKWGEMTMGFQLPAEGLPKGLAVGDSVTFEFQPNDGGIYQIVSIAPQGQAASSGMQQAPAAHHKGHAK